MGSHTPFGRWTTICYAPIRRETPLQCTRLNAGETLPMPAYLIKSHKQTDEPGDMFLAKNDPKYNEQWPRAPFPTAYLRCR
jgi:hypothetical protein